MPDYSKVQFIAWEIHTGPIRYNNNSEVDAFDYSGIKRSVDRRIDILSQCKDIDARVAFTEKAVLKALEKADNSPDTLKIFMGPEFLYRGSGGAYLHDLINGWGASPPFKLSDPYNKSWPGLFGGLKNVVAKDEFKDWVFIFGTAVSASFKTKKSHEGIYEIDIAQPAEAYNTAFIQLGGQGNGDICYASRKHLKSHIDFIDYRLGADLHKHNSGNKDDEKDINNTIFPLDPYELLPLDVIGESEGSAVFVLDGVNHKDGKKIKFGIEICLDHATANQEYHDGGLVNLGYGRLKYNSEYVDIQLVPSCGMTLEEDSVCLLPIKGDKPMSYAFNCDGLSTIISPSILEYGAHVQVWNQSDGNKIKPLNKLITVSNDFNHIDSDNQIRVDDTITLNGEEIKDTQLWNSSSGTVTRIGCYEVPRGSGYVQVFESKDLLPEGSI